MSAKTRGGSSRSSLGEEERHKLFVPKRVFFTKGVGTHKEELRSFGLALRDAKIEKCNLVQVSSILPPQCKIVSINEGIKDLLAGAITFVVISRCASNEPHRLIAASVGCAIPTDKNAYGYLSEHHAYGQSDKNAGEYAEDLAAAMLASTLGVEFDEDKSWDEKREGGKISGKIYRSFKNPQVAN